jgi:hypothetical protein
VHEHGSDSADDAYLNLIHLGQPQYSAGSGSNEFTFNVPKSLVDANFDKGLVVTYDITVHEYVRDEFSGGMVELGSDDYTIDLIISPSPIKPNQPPQLASIQNDYFAVTRTDLSADQATAELNAITAGTITEKLYVDTLLNHAFDTTIPTAAVEGSMYSAVGSSDEITKLVTQFLPAQIANATQNGLNPQVYACEALGLVFAFGDENGGQGFATSFGPANATMPGTHAGDVGFAAAASNAIFGSAANAGTPGAILNWVSNWEAFYTSHGIPGVANPTHDQIVLAARGAAWGDAVGVELASNLGSLNGQVINFLEDAAQGTATYSASLASQPTAAPFQAAASAASAAQVDLTGVAAHADHPIFG